LRESHYAGVGELSPKKQTPSQFERKSNLSCSRIPNTLPALWGIPQKAKVGERPNTETISRKAWGKRDVCGRLRGEPTVAQSDFRDQVNNSLILEAQRLKKEIPLDQQLLSAHEL
jgi:hypothetical protein